MAFAYPELTLNIKHNSFEAKLVTLLQENGLATFDHINTKEELISFSRLFGTNFRHRDADADGVTHVANSGEEINKDGFLGFSSSALTLHTDRSSALEPPTLIILFCNIPAREGGATLLADAKEIYEILRTKFPNELERLSTQNSAIFGGSEQPFISSVFNTLPNGNTFVRFRYDNLGYYTPAASSALQTFLEVAEQRSISFHLDKGQGYIIQNGRWLHGRTLFKGKREMYRCLINPHDDALIGKHIHFGFTPLPIVTPIEKKV